MKKIALLIVLAMLFSIFAATISAEQSEPEGPAPTVWFKPETLGSYSDGESVITWEDSSGNGWNAAQRTGTSVPTPKVKKDGLNGYPVLSYTGGQNLTFSNASIGANTQYTVVAVYRATGESTAMIFRTQNHGLGITYMQSKYGASITSGGFKFSGVTNSKSVGASEKFHITAVTWDINVGNINYYHDGVFSCQIAGAKYTPVTTDKNGQVHMGGDWSSAGDYLIGEIAEVMVFSSVLSADDLDNVGSGLADKYALNWTRSTPDPDNAEKPTVWFKPETLSSYSDGEAVTVWEDSSGNGWNAAQRLNTTVPTPKVKKEGLNGYPVLSYTGKENLTFNNASIGQNSEYTAYVVCRSAGNATSMVLRMQNGKGLGLTYIENKYGASTTAGGWKFFGAAGSATAGDTEKFHIMCVTWDTVSGEMKYYHDGLFAAEHTAKYTPTVTDAQSQVHIGADWSSTGNYFTGEIAEVIVFDSVLGNETLDKFGTDLAEKYGITWSRRTPSTSEEPKPTVWFKPETLGSYANGETVTVWEDSSGNGWNAAQRINTTVPTPTVKTKGINGYPVLLFSGKEDLTFSNASIGQNSEYTAIVVCRVKAEATSMILRSQNQKGFGLTYMARKYGTSVLAGGWKFVGAPDTETIGKWEKFHIMVATWDTESGELKYYHDGVLLGENSAQYTDHALSDGQSQVHIGGDWSESGNYLTGEIAEIMIFDSVLDRAELDGVAGELAHKYRLSWAYNGVPDTSDFVWEYIALFAVASMASVIAVKARKKKH